MSDAAKVTTEAKRAVVLCTGCEHQRAVTSAFAQVTGMASREWVCAHPEAYPPAKDVRVQRMNAWMVKTNGGREIGKTEVCPEWCPLRRGNA